MASISYLTLIILCLLVSYVQVVSTNINAGEFSSFSINAAPEELLFIVLMNMFVFFIFYGIYILLSRRGVYFSKILRFRLHQHKLNIIFMFILIIQLLFLLSTGVGRLLSDAAHPLSPVLSLFFPDAFFPVYYIINRTKINGSKNKVFYLNVILYSSLKLMQGWSGFILIIAFLELYHQTKYIKLKFRYICISTLIPLLILSAGGLVYKYVYQFKNDIRGTPVSEITYSQGVSLLASRLSMLPVSIAAYDRMDDVASIFNRDPIFMKEVVALGRPVLPRFIMPNKEFRPLNNHVLEAYYPEIGDKTSANMGFYMYLTALVAADFIQAAFYIVVLIFMIFLAKVFFSTIEIYRGQLNFIFFILLIDVANIASLEVVFGYGFIKVIPLFLLCWIFGGFKIFRSSESKVELMGCRI